MIDIGGQKLHLLCQGSGGPAVVLESGVGDFASVWALVQPGVARRTKVCSYDRAGYAWSQPGRRPRTYAQIALELHTALSRAGVAPPYVLVGQSYGGLLVRGFAAAYPRDVAGLVLVDAAHEDQRIMLSGRPTRIRDWAQGRLAPPPAIALDRGLLDSLRTAHATAGTDTVLEAPLDRLPADAQRAWRRVMNQPLFIAARRAEMDWSPEELARMHAERARNRRTLGSLPLLVLEHTPDSADPLDAERHAQQQDLVRLSTRGWLVTAPKAGHNIHLEEPALVVKSIGSMLDSIGVARSAAVTDPAK
ncbi:MAG: alpha/beta hydrolase [Gemmatimonadota bacterium]